MNYIEFVLNVYALYSLIPRVATGDLGGGMMIGLFGFQIASSGWLTFIFFGVPCFGVFPSQILALCSGLKLQLYFVC